MSGPEENITRILSEAANDLRIPTPIANLIVAVGAELMRFQGEINDLHAARKRQDAAIVRMAKEIDRLKGVHGA